MDRSSCQNCSKLTQTFREFEIVICDNASSDRTQEICRKYAGRDSRVRYTCNERYADCDQPDFGRCLREPAGGLICVVRSEILQQASLLPNFAGSGPREAGRAGAAWPLPIRPRAPFPRALTRWRILSAQPAKAEELPEHRQKGLFAAGAADQGLLWCTSGKPIGARTKAMCTAMVAAH